MSDLHGRWFGTNAQGARHERARAQRHHCAVRTMRVLLYASLSYWSSCPRGTPPGKTLRAHSRYNPDADRSTQRALRDRHRSVGIRCVQVNTRDAPGQLILLFRRSRAEVPLTSCWLFDCGADVSLDATSFTFRRAISSVRPRSSISGCPSIVPCQIPPTFSTRMFMVRGYAATSVFTACSTRCDLS
jgi:hypothetical protein